MVTFAQAKTALSRSMGAAGLADPAASINEACEELAGTGNWRELKRTVRLTALGEWFALPQEYDSIIRAAVDGTPVRVHGSEIEFLMSGPGDYDLKAAGLAPLDGIQDCGLAPVMYQPGEAMAVAFFSASPPTGHVRVVGANADGDIVSELVQVNTWTGPEDIDTMVPADVTYKTADSELVRIDRIVLPNDVAAYVSCYGVTDDDFQFLARMHPSVRVPQFKRFRMPGFSDADDASYRVLVQARVRFLPLIEDDDVLPFDSVAPVRYMIRALLKADADDVKGSEEFRALAEASLLRRENAQEQRQGVTVFNARYDGSPGQASNELYYNV